MWTKGGASAERVAHIVACAAPPLRDLTRLIDVLEERGWTSCVILTPTAATWIDPTELADRTGRPVRVRLRVPGETDPFPAPDALIAAPLTFNTLNSWAAGINDTTALGNLNRALGLGLPVVAAPVVSATLRAHPAYPASVAALTDAGATLLSPDATVLRTPDDRVTLDWPLVAAALPA